MKRFSSLLFLLLSCFVFSQTTVQEEAYKLYINAINQNNPDAKIQLLEQYLEKYGKIGLVYDKYVYANLAIAYNQKGNPEKTAEYGEKTLSFQDIDSLTKVNIYLIVSGAYNELNRNLEQAVNYVKMAKEIATAQIESGSNIASPDQWNKLIAGAVFLEGSISVKRGAVKEGVEKWAEAYKVLKSNQILKEMKRKGKEEYQKKNYANAELFLKYHFELSGDPESAYLVGKSYFYLNNLESSERYLLIAYEKRKNSEIALNLGIISNKKNKVDEAIRYFAEAVVLNSPGRFSLDAKKYLESLYQKKYGSIEGIEKVLAEARKRLGVN